MANNQPRTKGIRGSPVVHGARSGDRGLGLLLAGLGAGLGRRADRRDRAALASDAQAAGVEREGIRQAGMDRRAAAVLEFKKGEDHKDLRAAAEKYKLEADQLGSMLGHLEEIGVEAPGELLSRQEELHNSYGALAAKVVAGAANYASSGGPSAAGLPLDIPEDTASGLKARSKSYGDIASILDSGIKKAQTELKSSKVTGADREQAERRINEQIQKLLVLRVKQRNLEARQEKVARAEKEKAAAKARADVEPWIRKTLENEGHDQKHIEDAVKSFRGGIPAHTAMASARGATTAARRREDDAAEEAELESRRAEISRYAEGLKGLDTSDDSVKNAVWRIAQRAGEEGSSMSALKKEIKDLVPEKVKGDTPEEVAKKKEDIEEKKRKTVVEAQKIAQKAITQMPTAKDGSASDEDKAKWAQIALDRWHFQFPKATDAELDNMARVVALEFGISVK